MSDPVRVSQRLAEAARHPTVGEVCHSRGRPRSWLLIGAVITAFVAGGAAIIFHIWPLLWACVAITVLAIPVGKAMGIMDDTVSWHDPVPADVSDGQSIPRGGAGSPRRGEAAGQGGGAAGQGGGEGSPPPDGANRNQGNASPMYGLTGNVGNPAPGDGAKANEGSPPPANGGKGHAGKLAAVPMAIATGAAVATGWLIRRRTH